MKQKLKDIKLDFYKDKQSEKAAECGKAEHKEIKNKKISEEEIAAVDQMGKGKRKKTVKKIMMF